MNRLAYAPRHFWMSTAVAPRAPMIFSWSLPMITRWVYLFIIADIFVATVHTVDLFIYLLSPFIILMYATNISFLFLLIMMKQSFSRVAWISLIFFMKTETKRKSRSWIGNPELKFKKKTLLLQELRRGVGAEADGGGVLPREPHEADARVRVADAGRVRAAGQDGDGHLGLHRAAQRVHRRQRPGPGHAPDRAPPPDRRGHPQGLPRPGLAPPHRTHPRYCFPFALLAVDRCNCQLCVVFQTSPDSPTHFSNSNDRG